jgi:UDPglucose 6-dehydrogenase
VSIPAGTLVLLSSQVPAGFLAGLEKRWADHGLHFACAPENLRRGEAVRTFEAAERLVVGVRREADRERLQLLLGPLGVRIEWMSPESAEMTKHALNAWLATSVAFVNEAARLCQAAGADVEEVLRGLRSDPRVGDRPYFAPGVAFSGGTLSRDLRYLGRLAAERGAEAPLARAVLESNAAHQRWTLEAVRGALAGLPAPAVALLGLSGKVGTDALRHSAPLQLALALERHGVRVRAHDPGLRALPAAVASRITLFPDLADALAGADAAVLATPWPHYAGLGPDDFLRTMRRPCIIDPSGRLGPALAGDGRLDYRAPGRARVAHG